MIPNQAYLKVLKSMKGKPKFIRSFIKVNFTSDKPAKYRTILGFKNYTFESEFDTKKAMQILRDNK